MNNNSNKLVVPGSKQVLENMKYEIAREMGISRSYVSRIEKKALYKLLREFNKTK